MRRDPAGMGGEGRKRGARRRGRSGVRREEGGRGERRRGQSRAASMRHPPRCGGAGQHCPGGANKIKTHWTPDVSPTKPEALSGQEGRGGGMGEPEGSA